MVVMTQFVMATGKMPKHADDYNTSLLKYDTAHVKLREIVRLIRPKACDHVQRHCLI